MGQSLRQQARRQVTEAAANRKRAWAEREARLVAAAVEVVAEIVARDQAERAAAQAIEAMAGEQVTLTEIGERCGLPLKEVIRLKRTYLEPAHQQTARPVAAPSEPRSA
jgi:hypothetical protein